MVDTPALGGSRDLLCLGALHLRLRRRERVCVRRHTRCPVPNWWARALVLRDCSVAEHTSRRVWLTLRRSVAPATCCALVRCIFGSGGERECVCADIPGVPCPTGGHEPWFCVIAQSQSTPAGGYG